MGGEISQRIAIVAASMRAGGAERVALNLAEEFARRGLDIDLVLIDAAGPLLDEIPTGIRTVALGARRARGAFFALRRYLRRERPRAVLSIAFQTNILTMAAAVGLRPRPRIVLSVHNAFGAALAALSSAPRLALDAATRLLYPQADRVVAVSKGAAEDLQARLRLPPGRIVHVYNPVLRPDFHRLACRPAAGLAEPIPETKTIVTVGRLAPQKDQATLLRAFARVRRKRMARLLLIGEGELRSPLEALAGELGIAGDVVFAGLRSNPYPWMREADLFVLSSAWEGFGNVLIEAMATGTPVVATDCPHGPGEILENGKWGALVPPRDPDALADAMLRVLDGDGIDARERAGIFTVERAADAYLELLTG